MTPSYQYRIRTLVGTQTRPREHRLVFRGWSVEDEDVLVFENPLGGKAPEITFHDNEITEVAFSPHGEPYMDRVLR